MRLVNTSTLAMEMFFGEAVPYYAILSHRWNDVEVSLQDLQDGRGKKMAGYLKIQRCCAQAQSDGWQYAWIDSCCIDKTSSAELSEAINSMYSWYKNSQVCYAYLADVRSGNDLQEDLRKSNWFTRGWTLQELLAPSSVVFFDKDWIDIGTKIILEEQISKITGIEDFRNFETACIAQKMSWASRRETTRVEDMAYCLLGLFNVNMPPLYGEGEKAFTRLQLEILKTSDDESIFAWYDQPDMGALFIQPRLFGMLASSPKQFKYSGAIRPLDIQGRLGTIFEGDDYPFTMTNKGLHISLHLIRDKFSEDEFTVPLKCFVYGIQGQTKCCPAIFLQRKELKSLERYGRAFLRTKGKALFLRLDELQPKALAPKEYVRKYIYVDEDASPSYKPSNFTRAMSFTINTSLLNNYGFAYSQHWPPQQVPCAPRCEVYATSIELTLNIMYSQTTTGLLFVNGQTREAVILVLIVEVGIMPGLLLLTPDADQELKETTTLLNALRFGTASLETDQVPLLMLEGLMQNMTRQYFYWIREGKTGLDRVSRRLRSGKSVSASLRRQQAEGDIVRGVIEVELDSRAYLRWPTPSWAEKVMLSAE
ncbi:HET-domain-containing protein [Stipitochalara longipes BDJ]|nr:HET-domain-containing protein [Stipitochalara longipes BDJ]